MPDDAGLAGTVAALHRECGPERGPTSYPQPIGLASSWNPDLLREVGQAVGTELRAGPGRPDRWTPGPVVNPLRDPRWGRNAEGYAEDPWLAGHLATAYCTGLRGPAGAPWTAPLLRHFLAYNHETRRDTASSSLVPRVLHEYELRAYREPVESGTVAGVLLAPTLVNQRPARVSPLIDRHLRARPSTVDSDPPLVVAVVPPSTVDDGGVDCRALLRAGVDAFTGDRTDLAAGLACDLVDRRELERAARRALALWHRLRIAPPGTAARPMRSPDLRTAVAGTPAAIERSLGFRAVLESLVLLKNDGGALPLRDLDRIALIGPLAATDLLSGDGAVSATEGLGTRLSTVDFVEGVDRVALAAGPDRYVDTPDSAAGGPLRAGNRPAGFDLVDWGHGVHTLRAAANGRYLTVGVDGVPRNTSPGPEGSPVRETFRLVERPDGELVIGHIASGRYLTIGPDGALRANAPTPEGGTGFLVELLVDGAARAAQAAAGAPAAVVVLGNHPRLGGQAGEDRVDLALPPTQDRLVRAVHAANPRTVLVLRSGYPYGIGWAQQNLPAILWSAHGGQAYGTALAAALAGDVSPAGRLTQTWYHSVADLADPHDYDIIATDSTYLYHRGTPLYPFGHGLTYPPVEYTDLELSTVDTDPAGTVTVAVTVANTGNRDTDEVVQLYTRQLTSRVKQPLRQLRAFQRVTVPAGQRVRVEFTLPAAELGHHDVTRDRYVVERARHRVMVGRSSADLRQGAILAVHGEEVPPRDPRAGALPAALHDDYSGTIPHRTADQDLGDAVAATDKGGWICFAGVDLRRPVTGCVARLAGDQPGRLTLRLDDPLDGPVLGVFDLAAGSRQERVACDIDLPAGSGVRDLYVVFDSTEVRLWDLSFR